MAVWPRLHKSQSEASTARTSSVASDTRARTPTDPPPPSRSQRFDCFTRRATGGNHVFHHQHTLLFAHLKASPQRHPACFTFRPNETRAQMSGHFVANDDAADGRRSNSLD